MPTFESSLTTGAHGQIQSEAHQCLEECYVLALRSAADYALDFDAPALQQFQKHVRALGERVAGENAPDVLRSLQASFRGELRDYREKGQLFLQRLREELDGAAEAMNTFAGNLVANGADVEERVRGEISTLEKAAELDDIDQIRECVKVTAGKIAQSYDDLNRANALVIAELQHEIRLLHREIQTERRMAWTDAASGAWVKKKLDDRVDHLLQANDPFSVIVILITNLRRLQNHCSKTVVDGTLQALVKRFHGILGEQIGELSIVARISDDQFAAIAEVDSVTAQLIARETGVRLSSRYSAQENGIAQTIGVQVTCGIVGHVRGGNAAEFRRKLQQMTGLAETSEQSSYATLER